MGILQLYSQADYYIEVKRTDFMPGQFCWIVVPHLDPVPKILDVERSGPEEHDSVSFTLRNANQRGDFRQKDRTLPIKKLNLRSNEELLTQRAKKRPGIILASDMDTFPEITSLLRQKGKKHLQEDCLFVAPCYGVVTEDTESGFPPEMVARIRCCFYRQFFYCPPLPLLPKEQIVRFDRIQVVIGRDRSTIEPLKVALSPEVFSMFMAMVAFCITGEEDDNLNALRNITKESYPTK